MVLDVIGNLFFFVIHTPFVGLVISTRSYIQQTGSKDLDIELSL